MIIEFDSTLEVFNVNRILKEGINDNDLNSNHNLENLKNIQLKKRVPMLFTPIHID